MPKPMDVGTEEQAALIAAKLHEVFMEVQNLILLVDQEPQRTAFRQAIGCVCGSIVLDALAPLYKQYPALLPGSWPQDT